MRDSKEADNAKQTLKNKIQQVEKEVENKNENGEVGDQIKGSKAKLEQAKKEAQNVLNNDSSTTDKLKQAAEKLNTEIETYKGSTVKALENLKAPSNLSMKATTNGSITGYDKAEGEFLEVTSKATEILSVDKETELAVTAKKNGKSEVTVKVKDATGNIIKVGKVNVTVVE